MGFANQAIPTRFRLYASLESWFDKSWQRDVKETGGDASTAPIKVTQ